MILDLPKQQQVGEVHPLSERERKHGEMRDTALLGAPCGPKNQPMWCLGLVDKETEKDSNTNEKNNFFS